MFHGIEKSYTDAMVRAARHAQQSLFQALVEDAVNASFVQHKGDTLGLDQLPENAIVSRLQRFDPYSVTITEERGKANPFRTNGPTQVQGARTFFVCDPLDRSSQTRDFLASRNKRGRRVIDVFRQKNCISQWEESWSEPASITGATIGITCIRRGLPIAAVILNILTEEINLACPAGIFHAKLPSDIEEQISLDYIQSHGKHVVFPQPDIRKVGRIVSFIGKPERGYPANFSSCKLVHDSDLEKSLHYKLPGGPSRPLYLSHLQSQDSPVTAIVANGEKIGEWIHWFAFVRFALREDDLSAPALRAFEVSQNESKWVDGFPMMPSPDYSIFATYSHDRPTVYVSAERLQALSNPSRYRSTIIMFPASNKGALNACQQYGYRELLFSS